MQMSYLYASDFPFKNFYKIAQHTETIRKNVWEKSNDAYSLSIRVQITINHISILTLLSLRGQKKCFLSERELKKALRDTLTRAAWLGPVIFYWFVLSMRMAGRKESSGTGLAEGLTHDKVTT